MRRCGFAGRVLGIGTRSVVCDGRAPLAFGVSDGSFGCESNEVWRSSEATEASALRQPADSVSLLWHSRTPQLCDRLAAWTCSDWDFTHPAEVRLRVQAANFRMADYWVIRTTTPFVNFLAPCIARRRVFEPGATRLAVAPGALIG